MGIAIMPIWQMQIEAQRGSGSWLRYPRPDGWESGFKLRPAASRTHTPRHLRPMTSAIVIYQQLFSPHLEIRDLNVEFYMRKWIFIGWECLVFRSAIHSSASLLLSWFQIGHKRLFPCRLYELVFTWWSLWQNALRRVPVLTHAHSLLILFLFLII